MTGLVDPQRDERAAFDYPGPATAVALRAQHAGQVTVTTAERNRGAAVGPKIAALAEDWVQLDGGTWWGSPGGAPDPVPLDLALVRQYARSPQVLSPREAILTETELPHVLRAAVAAVERAAHAAPTVQVQTAEQALARCILASHQVWTERDGEIRWKRRPADPVRGGGPQPQPPLPSTAGLLGRVLARHEPDGEPVTVAAIESFVVAGGLLQPHQRPDWNLVMQELRARVAP